MQNLEPGVDKLPLELLNPFADKCSVVVSSENKSKI